MFQRVSAVFRRLIASERGRARLPGRFRLLRQPVRHDRHFHRRVLTGIELPIGKAAGIANSKGPFYVEDLANNLLLIDLVTGASRVLGNTGLGLNFVVFAGGDSGLYGIDYASNLYSFNSRNGTAALIGNTGLAPNTGQFDTSLSFDGTSLLYTAGRAGSKDELYRISLATGIATDLGSTGVSGITGSAFSDGKLDLFQYGQLANYLYTAADGSTTFSRGAALGATIVDGGVLPPSVSTETSVRTPAPVPESGTVINAASGLTALAFLVRRKRHARGIAR